MKRYTWWGKDNGWQDIECDRLEFRDNRVTFIGPRDAYLSIHNDEVRILRKEV